MSVTVKAVCASSAKIFVTLIFIPATAGAAFFFYGSSMLIAGVRRNGGCEITALSNALLRRDDQVGCLLFAPIDIAESTMRGPDTRGEGV